MQKSEALILTSLLLAILTALIVLPRTTETPTKHCEKANPSILPNKLSEQATPQNVSLPSTKIIFVTHHNRITL